MSDWDSQEFGIMKFVERIRYRGGTAQSREQYERRATERAMIAGIKKWLKLRYFPDLSEDAFTLLDNNVTTLINQPDPVEITTQALTHLFTRWATQKIKALINTGKTFPQAQAIVVHKMREWSRRSRESTGRVGNQILSNSTGTASTIENWTTAPDEVARIQDLVTKNERHCMNKEESEELGKVIECIKIAFTNSGALSPIDRDLVVEAFKSLTRSQKKREWPTSVV